MVYVQKGDNKMTALYIPYGEIKKEQIQYKVLKLIKDKRGRSICVWW